MSYQPTTAEHRLLWRLVAHSGEGFNDALEVDKGPRDSLQRARLIEVEKRTKQSGKRKVQAMYLRLTDAGWAWCNQDMSWHKPRGKAEQFLNTLLQRLKVLFERQVAAASLADFINSSGPATSTLPATPKERAAATGTSRDTKLDGRIRAACLELGGGREAVRIRIVDLRKRLADVPSDELTEGLRQLSRSRELTFYPLDDPRQITPDDEAAAILSSTGVPQHILYYGGIAS
jgi:hypothetical protein